MYVIKNPRANPNLRSPINRPEYHELDPEVQTLYRFDAGVDEGDDNFRNEYADNAALDDDMEQDDSPTTLFSTNLSDEASLSTPDEDGKSDGFDGYGGGSFGGGGSESEW